MASGPSARAHLAGRDDGLVRGASLIERVGRFADMMAAETDVSLFAALRDAQGTGRPLGSDEFIEKLGRLAAGRGDKGPGASRVGTAHNWNEESRQCGVPVIPVEVRRRCDIFNI